MCSLSGAVVLGGVVDCELLNSALACEMIEEILADELTATIGVDDLDLRQIANTGGPENGTMCSHKSYGIQNIM